MREIKFKAWNGEAMSKPFYPWALMPDGVSGLMDIHGFSVMWIGSGWKWLQFTGFHDKNGKDIYEGDIVKQTAELFHGEDEHIDKTYIGEVVILASRGVCLTNVKCKDNITGDNYKADYINVTQYRSEIIGNIHEDKKPC